MNDYLAGALHGGLVGLVVGMAIGIIVMLWVAWRCMGAELTEGP